MASGLVTGGHEGARAALAALWAGVAAMPFLKLLGTPGAHLHLDLLTRLMSPYQFNPLNINPLRDLLEQLIDFEALRRRGRVALYLSATNARTGDPRIFRETEISVEVLLASACLPHLHQAVEIAGETYWDGGFSANPPLLPLALETQCRTLLLIKLTPDSEQEVPTKAQPIFARMKRLLFNTPLRCDLDSLAQMQAQLRKTRRLPLDLRRLRELEVAQIAVDNHFFEPDAETDRPAELITQLHAAGRRAAERMMGLAVQETASVMA